MRRAAGDEVEMGFVGWVLLAALGAAAGSVPLPAVPDIRAMDALAPRPGGDCNAAVHFEEAEKVVWRSGRLETSRTAGE